MKILLRIVYCSMLFLQLNHATAQKRLEILGSTKDLYLTHTVVPKENWYSIGRIYNVSPKEMAPYNKLSLNNPLAIGQTLKVPLSSVNYSVDGTKLDDEVFIPLYHKVKEKEWMYRIATNYEITVAQLEQWNSIKNDQLRSGMSLIVGYLKVKQTLSPLAGVSVTPPVVAKPIVAVQEPVKIEERPKKEMPTATVKEVVVKTAPQELHKPMEPIVQPSEFPSATSAATTATANFNGGAFKKQFNNGATILKGNAGIFKSTSGWNDGKYYALVNDVPVGTIIRVSFSLTGKAIYAKVLGALPDMKESQGLIIRISDAAAAELGAVSNKFYAEVAY